jgi:hypothetical protein
MYLLMQQHALRWGGKGGSASASSWMFQTGREGENDYKGSVDTLLYNVVSRLKWWEGVERERGGEVDVVVSKFRT